MVNVRLMLLMGAWLLASYAPAQPIPARPAAASVAPVLPDSLAQRLERAYFVLGRVNMTARRAADTGELSAELPTVEDNLTTIRQNLDHYGDVVDAKQLQLYRLLLSHMQEQLGEWRTALASGSQQLTAMQSQLGQVSALLPAGDAPPAVGRALARLRTKHDRAAELLTQRRQMVTSLQTRVSDSYIQTLELQDMVREQLFRLNRAGARADQPPLWQPGRIRADTAAGARVRRSYAAQRGLVGYYFAEHWDYWAWMLALAVAFFGWVFWNFRGLRRLAASPADAGRVTRRLRYLRSVPVASTLLVVFSLAPFFDLQPPAAYTSLLQLLLLLVLTWLGWRSWPRRLFGLWLAAVALLLALAFAYAGRGPGLGTRWLMLALSGAGAWLGGTLATYLRRTRLLTRFVRPVAWLFAGLSGLAGLANVLGRVSLAKLLSTAGAAGLTQAVALAVFVRVVTEAFYLQAQRSRLAGGLGARLSFGKLESGLRKALTAGVAVLWLMLLAANLNFHTLVLRVLEHTLTAPHRLGSTTFTLGGILIFVGIILLTIQLQKYVAYLFGDTDDEFSTDDTRKGSWMVAVRLAILAAGLLLATVASGLPVDKIALVLGALGVGIGLGLQNIINNLVSGVILIFERPFQVGDYIEVNGKAGRVKDIGIRASKLISQAGSEVILPNGDLLSSHVINWTLSNNHIRTELALALGPDIDLTEARRLITEEVLANPNTLHKIQPEILVNNITTSGYDLKVLFWINNIRREDALKSELLASIYQRLTAAGIAMR